MIKDCFRGKPELKAYLIAYHGIEYYEEECFFGDGAVYGYLKHVYIEAYCVEEAKNLYRALTLQQEYVESDECNIHNIDCLGIYDEECGEPQFEYISFEERPKEYQRKIHHIGGNVKDLFFITDKQWRAINNLSEVTDSKFTGITKLEARDFISEKVKEVSEWKKSFKKTDRCKPDYGICVGYDEDEYYYGLSWLDFCGDM